MFIPVFLLMCNFLSNSEKLASKHSPSTIHLLVYTSTVYIERSFRTVNPYLCEKHFGFQWKHHFSVTEVSYHFYLPPSMSLYSVFIVQLESSFFFLFYSLHSILRSLNSCLIFFLFSFAKCIESWVYHFRTIENSLNTLKISLCVLF